jgi:DNA polymerase-1
MSSSIGRRGKNMPIQGTNASIAKRAFGCGFDKDRKPYLWHILPQYKAKMLNFVHDEILVQCPKRFSTQLAAEIQDCVKRAAGEVMSRVVMESEFRIAERWQK